MYLKPSIVTRLNVINHLIILRQTTQMNLKERHYTNIQFMLHFRSLKIVTNWRMFWIKCIKWIIPTQTSFGTHAKIHGNINLIKCSKDIHKHSFNICTIRQYPSTLEWILLYRKIFLANHSIYQRKSKFIEYFKRS